MYGYTVDCDERRLVLHTAFRNHEPSEFTDVVFREVIAHHFEHVLPGNILFDIEEPDVAEFVQRNAEVFADSWRFGWPPVTYGGDLSRLTEALKSASVRAYLIGSSYGLSGWVLAGSCQRVRRDGRENLAAR